MDQVIHGVNNLTKNFLLSNYSLTTQIVIINFSTAIFALFFLLIFNFFLLNNNKYLDLQKSIITERLNLITDYLSINAIKRILTFDDTCNRILKEININCEKNSFLDKNYEDKLPQLDPTYTQKYIYSNFLNDKVTVRVFDDNWIKFADTNDISTIEEKVIISDINSSKQNKIKKNMSVYQTYKNIYFRFYNKIQKYLDEKNLAKMNLKELKNDNILVMETIKTKRNSSYIYKSQEEMYNIISASPILKDSKVYGVVLINLPITFDNNESAYQSFLLINFFFFFISIMFFLSLLFSKSIVVPIKILSENTQLERNKSSNKKSKILYPNRKDEIGALSYDIKSMSKDLKKRIREIEQFAADVSHELKNPLSGLKSSSDLLITNKLDYKNKKKLIKNMGIDIERMNILITDISNYTLTQVEISEEAFEKINLINFLNDFKKSLFNNNYYVEIRSSEQEIFIYINKNKFTQVLHNILDNAFSYAEKQSNILLNITTKYQKCLIHIVDQGPGISLDYKDKIFERFYTDRNKFRNLHTGLGLSISRSIIESFNGKINLIKSTYPSFDGACFEIELPLKDLSNFK